MNAVDATKETIALVHDYLECAISGCDEATLRHEFPGATIGSIGSIYIHALSSEDWAIQQLLQGKPKIVDMGDWFARFGMEPAKDPDWSKANMDLKAFEDFRDAVFGATQDYLNSITDADLDKQIDWFGRGTRSAAWVFADVIHAHVASHAGEIAALKGVMGQKGLPW
jgi:hypothetical protein